jgi:TatD DNase family protein
MLLTLGVVAFPFLSFRFLSFPFLPFMLRCFCRSMSFLPSSVNYIDIGANLLSEEYSGIYHAGKSKHAPDVEKVLERAKSVGLSKIIVTVGQLADCASAVQLVKKYSNCYFTVGIHPTRTNLFNCDEEERKRIVAQLEEFITEGVSLKKCVAVGECGLDYDRLNFADKETQLKHFPLHLDLAEKYQLPLFLHDRNSGKDLLNLLTQHRGKFKGGVIHSFDGSIDLMQDYIKLGLSIGINGCSLKTEENCAAIKVLPLESLMIETDAPYCAIKPTHYSYKYVKTHFNSVKVEKYSSSEGSTMALVKNRNEPCTIVQIVEVIAAIKQLSIEEVAQAAYNNTIELFFSKQP